MMRNAVLMDMRRVPLGMANVGCRFDQGRQQRSAAIAAAYLGAGGGQLRPYVLPAPYMLPTPQAAPVTCTSMINGVMVTSTCR